MRMETTTFVLLFLAIVALAIVLLSSSRNRREKYASLDGSFGGGFARDAQNELCYTLYDRVYGIHDFGMDPMKCSNMSSKDFGRAMGRAEKCGRSQCSPGDAQCKDACIARQFVRIPLLDQTALPLLHIS